MRTASSRSAAVVAGVVVRRPSSPGPCHWSSWGSVSIAWRAPMFGRSAPSHPGASTVGARDTGAMLARSRRVPRAPSVVAPRRMLRRGVVSRDAASLVAVAVRPGTALHRHGLPPRGALPQFRTAASLQHRRHHLRLRPPEPTVRQPRRLEEATADAVQGSLFSRARPSCRRRRTRSASL